jgi:hypothetical protein
LLSLCLLLLLLLLFLLLLSLTPCDLSPFQKFNLSFLI